MEDLHFFYIGNIYAILGESGNIPVIRDWFMISDKKNEWENLFFFVTV